MIVWVKYRALPFFLKKQRKIIALPILFKNNWQEDRPERKLPEFMKTSEAVRLLKPYTIWVLAPHLESEDPNIQHYYDFTQSIKEYEKVFEELKAEWKWQPVTMDNYASIIHSIAINANGKTPLILNLCDGDEVNGIPGVSVIHELEKNALIYTGSDAHFYTITTSKIPMKKAFDKAAV